MANHFVKAAGNNANTGHSTDQAWATVKYAMESGALAAGDKVWIRSDINETLAADITLAYSGTTKSWIEFIGCPRNSFSITSSDWTNGSTSVNIDDNNMTESAHEGRFITAPDGGKYLITRVISTSSIVIDREYAGSTISNQAVTIDVDPDYTEFAAIDDSTWVEKIATWIADGSNRPILNFNSAAFQLVTTNRSYFSVKNCILKDSTDANGIYYADNANTQYIEGCLFKQSNNNRIIVISTDTLSLNRVIIKGSGVGDQQRGISTTVSSILYLNNSAIYNCGDNGMYSGASFYSLDNVNIGIEQSNGDTEISMIANTRLRGRDVKLGGTNGILSYPTYASPSLKMSIENYQKILNTHRTYFICGYYENVAVTSTVANKKLSDYVSKITPNNNKAIKWDSSSEILIAEIWVDDISKSYKFWIYNNASGTLNDTTAKDDIFLKVEYIKVYDDTSEYVVDNTIYSSQIDILVAADASDWDYLEVTGVDPAVADKVRLTIYFNSYSATGYVLIDPQVVIT